MPVPIDFEHQFVETNGTRLHVVTAGPADGKLVIFLHGFPEFWLGWRRQLEHFAARGYRVLAPDQRGYNLSAKPPDPRSYGLDRLVDDVLGLMDWCGRRQAILVGHDWGAVVAWWAAATHPERFEKLGILNVPHPTVMKRNLARNPRQMLRSWYMFAFQVPAIPEWLLTRRRANLLYRDFKAAGCFSEEELALYREAWLQPEAMRGMIHWYRAIRRHSREIRGAARSRTGGGPARITVPTLIVWGKRDRFLGAEMAEQSLAFCDDGRLQYVADATHWVHHERSDAVNRDLEAFFEDSRNK